MGKINSSENLHIFYLGNIRISGTINCLTGLHIGSSDDSLKIGGIDKYVIKNPKDNRPYIPGSSFKGKMRSLLEKRFVKPANRSGGENVYRYEADDINKALQCEVCRLFGSTSQGGDLLNFPARLIVRDFSIEDGFKLEKKSENTLDRLSAHANPRTNERVAKDSTFKFELDYEVQVIIDRYGQVLLGKEDRIDLIDNYWQSLADDLNNILDGLLLMEFSFLGGNGSRGYGKVEFLTVVFEPKTLSEILGEQAPPEIELSTRINLVEKDDKFKSNREEIPSYLRKFNGMYQLLYNSVAFESVTP